ncbi:MAG: hypothetical protein AB1751_04195 [Acidobacteriota bacterium]
MLEQAQEMIELLEKPGNRLRTGLLLVPPSRLEKAGEIAAHLLADIEDIAEMALKAIPPGSNFACLSARRIEEWLDQISYKATGQKRALVINLDLLLAGVGEKERAEVWHFAKTGMPYRPRVLIVMVPAIAGLVLPALDEWNRAGRCVSWL